MRLREQAQERLRLLLEGGHLDAQAIQDLRPLILDRDPRIIGLARAHLGQSPELAVELLKKFPHSDESLYELATHYWLHGVPLGNKLVQNEKEKEGQQKDEQKEDLTEEKEGEIGLQKSGFMLSKALSSTFEQVLSEYALYASAAHVQLDEESKSFKEEIENMMDYKRLKQKIAIDYFSLKQAESSGFLQAIKTVLAINSDIDGVFERHMQTRATTESLDVFKQRMLTSLGLFSLNEDEKPEVLAGVLSVILKKSHQNPLFAFEMMKTYRKDLFLAPPLLIPSVAKRKANIAMDDMGLEDAAQITGNDSCATSSKKAKRDRL